MDSLWAAIHTEGDVSARRRSKAPSGQVWTHQVRSSSQWIRSFLIASGNKVIRTWPLAAYLSTAADIILACDASPWGLGGVAYIRGVPRFYICEPLGELDYVRFGKRPTDKDNGQQVWECLAALVVL